jgi:hypothetical protein
MKPLHEMSEKEILTFGSQVVSDPTWHGFELRGRPILNCEMYAASVYKRQLDEDRRKAERFLQEEL